MNFEKNGFMKEKKMREIELENFYCEKKQLNC